MSAGSRFLSFARYTRWLARDTRGGAAIEFAIILPVMLGLAFGTSELCNVFAIKRKVTQTARTVSDIVAQGSTISDAEVANVLAAGNVLLRPYPDSGLTLMRVSAVNIDADKKATIAWSDASVGVSRNANDAVTIPSALLLPNTQLIWSEIEYSYKPPYFAIKSEWPFEDKQFFARPRGSSGKVCRSNCTS